MKRKRENSASGTQDKESGIRAENKKRFAAGTALLLFVLLVTVGGMAFFKMQMNQALRIVGGEPDKVYDKYYVMIVENGESSFWENVYLGAKEEAEENQVYLELLGSNLAVDYGREDLMRIAIDSAVDGIIVQADESEVMTQLINEAVEAKIPVVTVLGDNTAGKRQSFVGVGSYNLGREYGKQVLELARSREPEVNVLVLMDTQANDTSQNILYSGIQETIEKSGEKERSIQLELRAVSNETTFSAEESIRDIFMHAETLPDIIVCLDEVNTSCVYQAAVDYNKVGEVDIVGYYDSEAILRGVERNVIYSTIVVDTRQMGSYCAQALEEYGRTGTVSEYFSVDISLINAGNVDNYLKEAEDEKE